MRRPRPRRGAPETSARGRSGTDRPGAERQGKRRSRGGRPSRADAAEIGERILEIASALFLAEGYGAASIELVARRAGISKRTFYHRFPDKAALFGAVVHRLVNRLRPSKRRLKLGQGSTAEKLVQLARLILAASLEPEALALHRVIVAEAIRFPELARTVASQSAREEAIGFIVALLEAEARRSGRKLGQAHFIAEQFLQLVVSVPQRRALGLGAKMSRAEQARWAQDAVALFLGGCWGMKEI
jgi:TetR/AcrR family transcriptional regulator, mexJK operon transcriptional repressor